MLNARKSCWYHRYVLVFLLAAFGFHSVSVIAANSVKKPKTEMRVLQKLLKKLQVELKKERVKRSKEEQALQRQEQSIALLASQISVIDQKLSSLNKNLKKFQANRSSIKQQMQSLEKRLTLLIKQRYQMGDKTPLKLLINQENPEHVSRMLLYFEKVHQHLNKQIESYRTLLAQDKSNNKSIDKTELQLIEDKQFLSKQQSQLKNARVKRKKNLSSIDAKIAKNKSKIKNLAQDKKRLNKVISRIERAVAQDKRVAAKKAKQKKAKQQQAKQKQQEAKVVKVIDNRPFRKLKGKLLRPVKGKVLRKFGSFENNLAYDGIFIKAKQGSPVKAVHTGSVVFSDWLRSYGMVLIVDHGSGYLTLYGHNDQLNKKVGEKVFPGEVIARAGSSGGNQRSGLYFAVRRNGQATNPSPWLKR